MNKVLPEVITDILTHNGAIVEQTENGVLEVISTKDISGILNIPEYARLHFSYDHQSDDGIYASYDSEVFTSIAKLFSVKGRFSATRFETPIQPTIEKMTKIISKKVSFSNAIFHSGKTEQRNIYYLLVYFKYTALSDEKHEGILPVLINGLNLSVVPYENNISELSDVLRELESDIPGFNSAKPELIKVFMAAYSASTRIVEERLKDFVKSLDRRLNRDTRRVYEYYETLKKETEMTIERKAKTEAHTETKTIKGDSVERLRSKLDAIESERKWKIQDLISKYALSIQIEPVSAIWIETQASLFWINIKRRLASRQFPVTYNPLVKQMDLLPCESCFHPRGSYYICDDRLHIVCASCFKTCPDCRKQYCNACHSSCPKCRKAHK